MWKSSRKTTATLHPQQYQFNEDIADGERAVILDQVESGVAVRMAVLYLCAADQGDHRKALKIRLGAVPRVAFGPGFTHSG